MAGTGLNVKDIFEIKRLWKLALPNRTIAKALRIHRNTVNKYVDQFKDDRHQVVSWMRTDTKGAASVLNFAANGDVVSNSQK